MHKKSEIKKVNLHPATCNICGGPVIYTDNQFINGKAYGSGKCYICTKCGAYVGTDRENPEEALGLLFNQQMRTWKRKCHSIFDKFWRCGCNARQKAQLQEAAYKKLAELMRIPESECNFYYFDLLRLKKAYNCCRSMEKKMVDYTWINENEIKQWLKIKSSKSTKIHDYIGSIRIGTLCFDLLERQEDSKKYLYADLYVGGIDTGYAYGEDDYPYTYIDQIYERLDFDKLPNHYKEFRKLMEERITRRIRHAKPIIDGNIEFSLQEKVMEDLKIW